MNTVKEQYKMIKQIIDSRPENHKSSGKFAISRVGSCWRRTYLTMKGEYKEEFDAKTLRAFEIGDIFHRQAVKELLEKGDKFGKRVVAVEVDIPEQKNISGRTDIILSDAKTRELYLVDVKSCADWTLNKVKKGELDINYIQNYINQIQLYLHFFEIKKGYVLFFGKHRGETEELEVIYDKKVCLTLIKEIEDFFKNNIDKDIEPEKCQGGDFGCDCCGIKKEDIK